MSFDLLATVVGLNKLLDTSLHLQKIQKESSSDDFATLVKDFEHEVDKLNLLLTEQFGEDPEVMQLVFELKSAVIALKADNVEMAHSVS